MVIVMVLWPEIASNRYLTDCCYNYWPTNRNAAGDDATILATRLLNLNKHLISNFGHGCKKWEKFAGFQQKGKSCGAAEAVPVWCVIQCLSWPGKKKKKKHSEVVLQTSYQTLADDTSLPVIRKVLSAHSLHTSNQMSYPSLLDSRRTA